MPVMQRLGEPQPWWPGGRTKPPAELPRMSQWGRRLSKGGRPDLELLLYHHPCRRPPTVCVPKWRPEHQGTSGKASFLFSWT